MVHPQVRVKLVSSLLALTLATFGVQPCAASAMEHEMGTRSGHGCPEAAGSPVAFGEAPQGSPMPADCCAFSAPVDRQLPAQSTGASDGTPVPPVDSAYPVVPAVVSTDLPATTEGPPAAPAVRRHLLLSVLLI